MKEIKPEDEYVWAHELRTRMAQLEEQQQAQSKAEKHRLKELHWMHCPKCGQELATEQCGSVEVDVCPSCKGVWLDAGELGKIIEDSSGLFRSALRALRVVRPASEHLETKPKAGHKG